MIAFLAQVKQLSEFHPSWLRSCATESMSVLTDPATCGVLNRELTNCPRTAAVLVDLAAQWQQMMGTLQRVERETVSSQSLANIEKMSKTRVDATGNRLRLKDGERPPRQQLYFHFPLSLSAQRWLSKSLLKHWVCPLALRSSNAQHKHGHLNSI